MPWYLCELIENISSSTLEVFYFVCVLSFWNWGLEKDVPYIRVWGLKLLARAMQWAVTCPTSLQPTSWCMQTDSLGWTKQYAITCCKATRLLTALQPVQPAGACKRRAWDIQSNILLPVVRQLGCSLHCSQPAGACKQRVWAAQSNMLFPIVWQPGSS